MTISKLKACPFCGGAMQLRYALWPSEGDTDAVIHAAPTECPIEGAFSVGTADDGVTVTEVWNRRAQPSAPDGWVMVPEEPTREMLDIINTMRGPAYIYRDLLDARPLPPAPTAEEPVDDLQSKIDTAKAKVGAMSPEEREAMYRAQRESFARGMSPCEHGVADWEDCPDCRTAPTAEGV